MLLRATLAVTVLTVGCLIGAAVPAVAQFYPPRQIQPLPVRPLPPVEADDDLLPPYDPPPGYRQPGPQDRYALPPRGYEPSPGPQFGRRAPGYPEDAEPNPSPPGYIYREPPPGYEPIDPRSRIGRPGIAPPNYGAPPPNYGAAPPPPTQDALRPPMSIGPQDEVVGALPPEERPETGLTKELPPQFRRTMVDYRTREPAGTIIIDTANTYLYLVLGNGKAMRYGIGVGRDGFTWAGAEKVSRMAEWPDWHPPTEMIERQPYLPRFMAGGPGNPLGARALYLGKTLYRIHGTNQPSTIGSFVSSGCIRLTNEDVADLYTRVQVGTRVVVLAGGPPPSASAIPIGPSAGETPPGPYNPLAPPRAR
jgi:lipoprotein-anchoring transpeptidase ErfK/SrfK